MFKRGHFKRKKNCVISPSIAKPSHITNFKELFRLTNQKRRRKKIENDYFELKKKMKRKKRPKIYCYVLKMK